MKETKLKTLEDCIYISILAKMKNATLLGLGEFLFVFPNNKMEIL